MGFKKFKKTKQAKKKEQPIKAKIHGTSREKNKPTRDSGKPSQ
jgi:hypothetical protein